MQTDRWTYIPWVKVAALQIIIYLGDNPSVVETIRIGIDNIIVTSTFNAYLNRESEGIRQWTIIVISRIVL